MTDENPKVSIDMLDYTRQVSDEAAEKAARLVIREHVTSCRLVDAVSKLDNRLLALDERFRVFEKKFAYLIGAIISSGALGGSIGAAIIRLFGNQ